MCCVGSLQTSFVCEGADCLWARKYREFSFRITLDNGGIGFIAARHLQLFGYDPEIYYPKEIDKLKVAALTISNRFQSVSSQCRAMDIKFHQNQPKFQEFKLIVDAIFGCSFVGTPNDPFDTLLKVRSSYHKIHQV